MFTQYMRKEELIQKSKDHYNKMKLQFEMSLKPQFQIQYCIEKLFVIL
jgi:hypothetical protein